MKKVSDIIADFLKELDIKIVFGIIGSANSHIFDSITKLGFTQIVFLHHEQACVMAMGAYFRASGKLSAALVTAGGGATNAVTGIVSNWADSIPWEKDFDYEIGQAVAEEMRSFDPNDYVDFDDLVRDAVDDKLESIVEEKLETLLEEKLANARITVNF
jgi:glyoxylate carboligase